MVYRNRPMQIHQFDKMADYDQNEYVSELIMGTQQVLIDAGNLALAERVHTLFRTKKNPADRMSIGMADFVANLARGRDSHAGPLEVEDALIVTLRNNGIDLLPSFLTVNKDFKPRHPAK